METIFALASGRGRSGVAVIRISGPRVDLAAKAFGIGLPPPGMARLRRLQHSGEQIDSALVLHFPKGHSFTGEETVEFHLHGSVAVVEAVLRLLGQIDGFRPADPGEFTRRALENDRMDLAQVEGLADLIDAETEAQRRQAMRVFSGEMGSAIERWRNDLIEAAALLEVTIDFADEEVPTDVGPDVRRLVAGVRKDLTTQIEGYRHAERVRLGFEVAIIGPPNVGKSTLLNSMAGRDAAITSEIAGTTRDVVEVRMDLDGLPVTLLDTAGIRESDDRIEQIGVARARERAEQADLRVFLTEAPDAPPAFAPRPKDIVVNGRADMHGSGVSGLTGEGVSDLLARIVGALAYEPESDPLAVRERHVVAMRQALTYLEASVAQPDAELAAENLRYAVRSLEVLTGRIGVEDLLDRIFSSFCIGK